VTESGEILSPSGVTQ